MGSFSFLPRVIREELIERSVMALLVRHPFFLAYQHVEPAGFRRLTCDSLQEVFILPDEEAFRQGQTINQMVFGISGILQYMHGDELLEDIFVQPGQWALEEALWGKMPALEGPIVAGMSGCEFLAIRAKDFHDTCKIHSRSVDLVVCYAENFIQDFNKASRDDTYHDLLFNEEGRIKKILSTAVKQRYGFANRLSQENQKPASGGGGLMGRIMSNG